ncbi:MAG TPA: hypothetical protein VFH73_26470 [Polyangia bacterium]|jgi:hypothetical protein|nr:hypothetical protein [Polyangia bacterium]
MNPESRLSEDGADEFEAKLLRSARTDGASANRERTLAALAIAGTAALAGGVGAAKAKGVLAGALRRLGSLKMLAVMSLVVAAGAVGVAAYKRDAGPAADAHAMVDRAPTLQPRNVAGAPALPSATEPPVPAMPSDRPALPSPSVAAPRSRVTKARSRPALATADSLLQEVAILDRARGQLLERDGVAAARTADSYLARFPNGRLAGEAKVIRIRAALLTGGHAAAAPLAESFLRQHPDSPHAPELRKILRAAAAAGNR